jgi:hypothetical protein
MHVTASFAFHSIRESTLVLSYLEMCPFKSTPLQGSKHRLENGRPEALASQCPLRPVPAGQHLLPLHEMSFRA